MWNRQSEVFSDGIRNSEEISESLPQVGQERLHNRLFEFYLGEIHVLNVNRGGFPGKNSWEDILD